MRRLTLNNQVSQAPAMTPVGPSSGDSSSFCAASLQGLKYSTYDGNRSQEEVKAFLDVFAVVRSLNSLSDKDLVRFVVHHLRGDALLWWLELSESNRSQHLLDDWTAFKSALRRRFVRRIVEMPLPDFSSCVPQTTFLKEEIEETCTLED
ncbi:hypothetical protein Efla_007239 [Eimeria flavescens]